MSNLITQTNAYQMCCPCRDQCGALGSSYLIVFAHLWCCVTCS
jgi:hypothetical protein